MSLEINIRENPKLNDEWYISTWMMGEVFRELGQNHLRLHDSSCLTKYGILKIVLSAEWKENVSNKLDDIL